MNGYIAYIGTNVKGVCDIYGNPLMLYQVPTNHSF